MENKSKTCLKPALYNKEIIKNYFETNRNYYVTLTNSLVSPPKALMDNITYLC